MKKENGITLAALVIYIVVMVIVMGTMSTIINRFYDNHDAMQEDTEEIIEFNKFNTYFLKEIKSKGNSVDSIGTDGQYILFTSGNSFSFANNKIYYNDLEICENVNELLIQQGKDGDGIDKKVIYITLKFNNFTKSINYKVEEIY